MKQIKLKDGITLMAVELAYLGCKYEITEPDENGEVNFVEKIADGIMRCMCIGKGNFTLLGTAPELLAREDAEEVCRKYVALMHLDAVIMSMPMGYKIYCGSEGITESAKASFQSSLSAMNYVDGEILIVREEGE